MVEEDPILQQIVIRSQKITTIFSLVPNVSILRPDAFDPKNNEANSTPDFDSTNNGINSAKLTAAEEQAIVESRGENSRHHIWKLNKLQDRKNAKYATCKATMPPGKIFVEVNALYIPPNQSFAVNRTFYFCSSFHCLKKVPSSSIVTPSTETLFKVMEGADIKNEERDLLKARGLKFSYD